MSVSTTLFWRVRASVEDVPYDLSRDLSSFTIEEEDRSPTMLTVQLADPFTIFSHAFREGMDIEAELGTEDDHRTLFRGRIYHVDSSLPQQGAPTLTLKAYDATMLMGLQERNRRFRDVTLRDVVTQVAQPQVEPRPVRVELLGNPRFEGEGLRQREETDLAFLRRLADDAHAAMGMEIGPERDEFLFVAQQTLLGVDPEVVLHYLRCGVPTRLLTFDAQADVANIAVPRTVAGTDPTTGETVDPQPTTLTAVGRAEDRLRDDNLAAFEERHPDRAAAIRDLIDASGTLETSVRAALGTARREALPAFATPAQAAQVREHQPAASLHGMQATGSTVGNKELHARRSLGIEGAGRFSGTWYVTKATHAFDRQGYRTDFTCVR